MLSQTRPNNQFDPRGRLGRTTGARFAVGSNGVADISQNGPNDSTCTIVQSGLFGGVGITSAPSGELDALDVTAAHNALQWVNFGYQLRGVLPQTVEESPEHPTIGGLQAVVQKVAVKTKGGKGTACEPNAGALYVAEFASRERSPRAPGPVPIKEPALSRTKHSIDALFGMNVEDSACAARAALLRLPASSTCATEVVLPDLHRLSSLSAPFPPVRRYLTRAR